LCIRLNHVGSLKEKMLIKDNFIFKFAYGRESQYSRVYWFLYLSARPRLFPSNIFILLYKAKCDMI